MEELPDTSKEDIPADNMVREQADETFDDHDPGLLKPAAPENWNLDEKYVETSILRLNIAIMKSDERAVQIDSQLRMPRPFSQRHDRN